MWKEEGGRTKEEDVVVTCEENKTSWTAAAEDTSLEDQEKEKSVWLESTG